MLMRDGSIKLRRDANRSTLYLDMGHVREIIHRPLPTTLISMRLSFSTSVKPSWVNRQPWSLNLSDAEEA